MNPTQIAEYERAWCDGDPDTDVNEARAVRELVGEVRHLRAKLAAYTDLPPEPDTAMGAFMAVLAVDNDPEEPDNYAGDCDGESR